MIPSGYILSGTGEPVVLIHGAMSSKGQWQALIGKLEKAYTVIAVDLTGYGRTPFPEKPEGHSLEAEVALIRQTISALVGDHAPVHLVAHSYGGAVALCYASRFPAEVRSLALFEPMANHLLIDFEEAETFSEGRLLIEKISDLVAMGEPKRGARTFLDYFSGNGVFDMLPEKAQATLAVYVVKMLIDFRTTMETSLTMEDYRGIACPLCLITGTASSDVSLAIARILRDQMDAVRWFEIPGNHMSPIAHPEVVNPVFIDWLDHVTPAAGRDSRFDPTPCARQRRFYR